MLFKKARAFKIDGKNVARWALHLCEVYNRPPPDPQVIRDYMNLGPSDIPRTFVEAAITARNEEEAKLLAKTFVGDREGYANTNQMPTAEVLGEACCNPEALLDDDGELKILSYMSLCLTQSSFRR